MFQLTFEPFLAKSDKIKSNSFVQFPLKGNSSNFENGSNINQNVVL